MKIVIIGGGVIGCSVACNLALDRQEVVLFEKGVIGSAASTANSGFTTSWNENPEMDLVCSLSTEIYPSLSRELSYDIEYARCGSLTCAENEAQAVALRQYFEKHCDVSLEWLERPRDKEPAVATTIPAAIYSAQNGVVNPMRLTYGLARAAARAGADIRENEEVLAIESSGSTVRGVRTGRADYAADVVINCGGAWADAIAQLCGKRLAVRPIRNHCAVTARVAPLIHATVSDCRFLSATNPGAFDRRADGLDVNTNIGLTQTKSGGVLLGWTAEDRGFDCPVAVAPLAAIARASQRLIPALGHVSVVRAWSNLEPNTPDGLPYLGAFAGLEGFINVCGFELGVSMAPAAGALARDLLRGDDLSSLLTAFSPDRFGTEVDDVPYHAYGYC